MATNDKLAVRAESVLANVEMDPRILMAAKAIQIMQGRNDDGSFKVTEEAAIAAALYQAGTGQLIGRDFYMNDKVGRMEGYRGVSRDAMDRGVGELEIRYRPLRADEIAENEVKPGDTSYACEVYQLRAWRMAQKMGQPYTPIIGIGIWREVEKYTNTDNWKEAASGKKYKAGLNPREQWRPIILEGGMTWAKKAKNRAYKDALRHVPGAPASPDEVIEEATLRGVEPPPESARLSMEQAEAWVRQNEITEGQFTPVKDEAELAQRLADNVKKMRGDESDDPFGDVPPPPGLENTQSAPPPAKPAPPPAAQQPVSTSDDARAAIIARLRKAAETNTAPADETLRKRVWSYLRTLTKDDENRAKEILALFGDPKALTAGTANILIGWIKVAPDKDENGQVLGWRPTGPAISAGEYAILFPPEAGLFEGEQLCKSLLN